MEHTEFDKETSPELIAERYRIQRVLGHGGMASVYEGVEQSTGTRVAIKKLHSHRVSGDGHIVQLFELEYHTLSQLAHPRVVAVYDYQRFVNGAFYTMELLDGGDLREQRPLPWRELCSVLCDVCSALSLLHSRRMVHRDVTPRNIRRTHDGKAKLIDFGAMVSFGTHHRVVGTPSFSAPEVVTSQPLDGRTDLFSLGATAYYCLTGRHAYPARSFTRLRNIWRSQPAVPSRYVPDIPPDLDQLVMWMLNLSPSRRPNSAVTIIERLTAIAGIQLEEQLQVQHSFLSTPNLVGRGKLLQQIRRQTIQAARGRGAVIFLTGPQGVGRSRMVDACALEGKLASAVVLRADASDAQDGDWAGVRSLLDQLVMELPVKVIELLASDADILIHIWPRLSDFISVQPKVISRSHDLRPMVQRALMRLMVQVSQRSLLVVTADDIDRLDEPTAAFIALLAQQVHNRRLVVVAAADQEALETEEYWLRLIHTEQTTVELSPLPLSDTEQLLSSVFGEVPNVRLLANRLYEVSSGLPSVTMQLAQHLLDQDIIHFHHGSWILPSSVDREALPSSLTAALAARLDKLDDVSKRLAQAIALSGKAAVSLEECGRLLEESDRPLVLRHLDTLTISQVVKITGDRYAISQPIWKSLLLSDLDRTRKQVLHERIAKMFVEEESNAEISAARHLLAADNPSAAIDMLLLHHKHTGKKLNQEPSRLMQYLWSQPSGLLTTFEEAIAAADRLKRPLQQKLILQIMLLKILSVKATPRLEMVQQLVQQLCKDSGLRDYKELDGSLPHKERLMLALEQAQERYEATPEAMRGFPTAQAIEHLARAIVYIIGMVGASANVAFLRSLPSLAPFGDLSPAIDMVQRNLESTCCVITGKIEQAHTGYLEILARMDNPEGIGLTPSLHRYMYLAITYSVALCETHGGLPSAAERIELIERDPLFEVTACRLKALHALLQGNVDMADFYDRGAELLKIQNSPTQMFEGTEAWYEALAYAEIGDVARLRQTVERLNAMAEKYLEWTVPCQFAQSYILLLRGETEAAAKGFEYALSLFHAREGGSWAPIVRGYLTALAELGRIEEARQRGVTLLAEAERVGLTVWIVDIYQAMAEVELAAGQCEAALAYLQKVEEIRKCWSGGNVCMGAYYELRARVNLAMHDDEAFRTNAERCAKYFLPSRNPMLIARHQRLLQDAERSGIESLKSALLNDASDEDTCSTIMSEDVTMSIEMSSITTDLKPIFADCDNFEQRVARVLALVVENGMGRHAMLYLLRDHLPQLVGQTGTCPDEEHLNGLVARFLHEELGDTPDQLIDPNDMVTSTVDNSEWMGPSGVQFAPVLLSHPALGGMAITGVLIHELESEFYPPDSFLSELSIALTASDDVTPILVKSIELTR